MWVCVCTFDTQGAVEFTILWITGMILFKCFYGLPDCNISFYFCHSFSWNVDNLLLHSVFMCSAILFSPLISHLPHAAHIDVIAGCFFLENTFNYSLSVRQQRVSICCHSFVLWLAHFVFFFVNQFSASCHSFFWVTFNFTAFISNAELR